MALLLGKTTRKNAKTRADMIAGDRIRMHHFLRQDTVRSFPSHGDEASLQLHEKHAGRSEGKVDGEVSVTRV